LGNFNAKTQKVKGITIFHFPATKEAMYRVAKKVGHYQESSLNRIKNRPCGYISPQF